MERMRHLVYAHQASDFIFPNSIGPRLIHRSSMLPQSLLRIFCVKLGIPSLSDVRMAQDTISQMCLAELDGYETRPHADGMVLTQEYRGDKNSLGTSTARFFRSSDAGMWRTICAADSLS